MKCRNCNYEMSDDSTFCPNCGFNVGNTTPAVGNVKQNSSQTNITLTEEKKKSSGKIKYIVIIILSILIVGLLTFFLINHFTNNGSKSNNKKEEKQDDTTVIKGYNEFTKEYYYYKDIDVNNLKIEYDNDESKKITVEKAIYVPQEKSPGKLVVLAKNEYEFSIVPDIKLDFLDKNGKRVSNSYSSSGVVGKGQKFVITFNSTSSENEFVSHRLMISADKYKSYEHDFPISLSDINKIENEDNVELSYTNNTYNSASINISAIYYKNNEIIYMENIPLFVKPTETGISKMYFNLVPGTEYNGERSFDKYEIILSGAKYNDNSY